MQHRTLFGEQLRHYRELAGLTQEQLAEKAGLTAKAIGALERGDRRRPYPTTVQLLATALKLSDEQRAAFIATLHQGAASVASQSPDALVSQAPPIHLPVYPTPFVGRDVDVAAVCQRLQHPHVRLLTLTGPGGTGKTRLSVQAATMLLPMFADGVYFVSLAPVRHADLVASTIAHTLGVEETGAEPLADTLAAFLRPKHILLVMDNFEHVLDAAPLISHLLHAAPALRVLATSREMLHVYGEHAFPVLPLALPDAAHLADLLSLQQYEAVRLFIERAQAVQPSFQVTNENAPAVAEICHRLDGLPLAIELAAARIRLLPPQALLARLEKRLPLLVGGARDLPQRQQTLRSAIDWSYNLLPVGEQMLFRRLSVFVGCRTPEAVEAVCTVEGDLPLDVLDGLQSLLDKNLLFQKHEVGGEPSFAMLETIWEYARERLEDSGEASRLRRQHATYYLLLVKQAEAQFFGSNQKLWFDRMEAELNNIRAALAWSQASADGVEIGLQIAGLLWRFWAVRGHGTEGRTWLDGLLSRRHSVPLSARWFALHTAGNLADDQGDFVQAKAFWEECLEACRELGNKRFVGHMLNNLGEIAASQAAYNRAAPFYEEALQIYREVLHTWAIGMVTRNLAEIAHMRGEYDRARELLDESIRLLRERGDTEEVAWSVQELGRVAYDTADIAAATQHFAEAQRLFEEVGSKRGVALVLADIGEVARHEGDSNRAAVLLEQSLALQQEIRNKEGIALALYELGHIAYDRADYGVARSRYTESLRLQESIGNKRSIAALLEAFAALAFAEQHMRHALCLLSTATALRREISAPTPARERDTYEHLVMQLRASLDQATFDAAWSEGQKLSVEHAIQRLLR
jgi:predicted ATPase/transcriptional regulator with XRE-family HTH domain